MSLSPPDLDDDLQSDLHDAFLFLYGAKDPFPSTTAKPANDCDFDFGFDSGFDEGEREEDLDDDEAEEIDLTSGENRRAGKDGATELEGNEEEDEEKIDLDADVGSLGVILDVVEEREEKAMNSTKFSRKRLQEALDLIFPTSPLTSSFPTTNTDTPPSAQASSSTKRRRLNPSTTSQSHASTSLSTPSTSAKSNPSPEYSFAPHSLESYLARMQTFLPSTYSSKPIPLQAENVARFGWINTRPGSSSSSSVNTNTHTAPDPAPVRSGVDHNHDRDRDILYCPTCSSHVDLNPLVDALHPSSSATAKSSGLGLGSIKLGKKAKKRLVELFEERLRKGHGRGCGWRVEQTPLSLYNSIIPTYHPLLSTRLAPIARELEGVLGSVTGNANGSRSTKGVRGGGVKVVSRLNAGETDILTQNLRGSLYGNDLDETVPISEQAAVLAFHAWSPYKASRSSVFAPPPATPDALSNLDTVPVPNVIETVIPDILHCHLCSRKIGLALFRSSSGAARSLDAVREHREYCPVRVLADYRRAREMKEEGWAGFYPGSSEGEVVPWWKGSLLVKGKVGEKEDVDMDARSGLGNSTRSAGEGGERSSGKKDSIDKLSKQDVMKRLTEILGEKKRMELPSRSVGR